MKEFVKICQMTQKKLKKYVIRELGDKVETGDGWVFREGSFPVLLVAHMDTVHKNLPSTVEIKGNMISSPMGIGGDDRCGVYMIFKILKDIDCSVLFVEDEEIGCIGSTKFTKTELCKKLEGKFNYLIELDRKGKNDAVFYECGNEKFMEEICKSDWVLNYGSYTDICELAPALNVSAVNFSCGYYKAHTKEEYVMFDEMLAAIEMVKRTLTRMPDLQYEWIENKYRIEDEIDFDAWYISYLENGAIRETISYGDSLEEAIGSFLMENDDLRYRDIINIQEGWNKYEEKCEYSNINGHLYHSFEW